MIKIKKGDYVLATKYRDGDPLDQWCIGFYKGFLTESLGRHEVVDSNGKSFRGNGFRRVKKISPRRGEFILSKREEIEVSGKSLWWWARQPLDGGRQ
jgi:hypothetical protein